MSRKTAAERNDKMDALIYAINRLAESQEKANERMEKSYELNRQHLELGMKQYALNVDNHQYNREQAEKAEEHNLKQQQYEHTMQSINQAIKDYVDENINSIIQMLSQERKVMGTYLKGLEDRIEAKADKADEKELAEKISKKIAEQQRNKFKMFPSVGMKR